MIDEKRTGKRCEKIGYFNRREGNKQKEEEEKKEEEEGR